MNLATPDWTKDAADLLRQFLNTPAGQAFLAHVAEARPPLPLGGNSLEAAALAGATAAGYEHAFRTILSLAEPPIEPAAVVEAYPSLDDDSKWNNPT